MAHHQKQMDLDYNIFEGDEDREHFENVVASFKNYRTYTLARINKRCRYISSLSELHQEQLKKYSAYLAKFRACVEVNDRFLELAVRDAENIFLNVSPPQGHGGRATEAGSRPQHLQVDKVQSVLRQFVRDWSTAGLEERNQCYQPIIDEIRQQFPAEKCSAESVSVLVPGAGLGRLAWQIAQHGYVCQGNDVSMYMLLASNFLLNHTKEKESYTLYPWLNDFSNNESCEDQLASVRVPDELPSQVQLDNLSMVAGDFLQVYTSPEWNCVATCFFIDCAQNVIEFAENIHRILRPGGVWINLGPLLYHWSDMPEKDSIEPPYDILMDIIQDIGFVVEKQKTNVRTKYAQNPKSMLQREYNSVFFVCRKRFEVDDY